MAARKAVRSKRTAPAARSRAKKTAPKKRRAAAAQPDRRKKKPESLRLRALEPSFTVSDLERSLRYYADVLGFTVGERFTDDGGVLRGAMVKAGACQIGLSQDDWAKGRDRQRGVAVRVWCQTAQDIDQLAAQIKSRGGQLAQEPADQPWGGRAFAVNDPDGFHLTIYRD